MSMYARFVEAYSRDRQESESVPMATIPRSHCYCRPSQYPHQHHRSRIHERAEGEVCLLPSIDMQGGEDDHKESTHGTHTRLGNVVASVVVVILNDKVVIGAVRYKN
jgi:hypothetical protein